MSRLFSLCVCCVTEAVGSKLWIVPKSWQCPDFGPPTKHMGGEEPLFYVGI